MAKELYVTKASGEKVAYRREQLLHSLLRAGASEAVREGVVREVEKKLTPGIPTQKLWELARHELQKRERQSGLRYGLKQAMLALGPTGFPFEKYVAEILNAYGYETELDRMVRGACVSHEVDVIAKKGEKHFLIEAKYHHEPGSRSDVKVALYVWARFQDIRRAWEEDPVHENEFHQAWLMTNTKCTSDAIQFAECAGLKVVSWRYPKEGSLEALIEEKKLYPITILPDLKGYTKSKLVEAKIMLAQDLLAHDLGRLSKDYKIPLAELEHLKEDAMMLAAPS